MHRRHRRHNSNSHIASPHQRARLTYGRNGTIGLTSKFDPKVLLSFVPNSCGWQVLASSHPRALACCPIPRTPVPAPAMPGPSARAHHLFPRALVLPPAGGQDQRGRYRDLQQGPAAQDACRHVARGAQDSGGGAPSAPDHRPGACVQLPTNIMCTGMKICVPCRAELCRTGSARRRCKPHRST